MREFPVIVSLGQEFSSDVNMVVLSVDSSRHQLDAMIKNYTLNFPLFQLETDPGWLADRIQTFGGRFRGGVPYTAILDARGKLLQEFPGAVDHEVYSASISEALRTVGHLPVPEGLSEPLQ